MTTRPAALTAEEEASIRRRDADAPPSVLSFNTSDASDRRRLLATLDREREDRRRLLDRLRRVHYPPQIGTHYEQGFADCLRAVLAEFERP